MSMSEDDKKWLEELLVHSWKYKEQRFKRGSEEHSDAPLRARACFPEALQEIDDAQTYLFTFRERLRHWATLLTAAVHAHDQANTVLVEVISQIREELKDEPPGPVYLTDSGAIR